MWTQRILPTVFNRVKEKVSIKLPGVHFTTSLRSSANPEFPTVSLKNLGGGETGQDVEGITVNAITSNIQIDVISNRDQNEADIISNAVMDAMKSMRYTLIGDPFMDESDATTYRNVIRFRRIVGHGDTL